MFLLVSSTCRTKRDSGKYVMNLILFNPFANLTASHVYQPVRTVALQTARTFQITATCFGTNAPCSGSTSNSTARTVPRTVMSAAPTGTGSTWTAQDGLSYASERTARTVSRHWTVSQVCARHSATGTVYAPFCILLNYSILNILILGTICQGDVLCLVCLVFETA
jgi:hypothetical protein